MALAEQEFRISLWRAEMGLAFALSGQTSARRPVVPVGTTVPTLVLAGQFDPVAGSALSRQVADEIGAHARGGAAVGVASGSIPHPIRSLCTLRIRRRRRLRNTRFPAVRYRLTGAGLSPAGSRQLRLTHRNRRFESVPLQR